MPNNDGLARALQELTRDGRVWVDNGIVDSIEAHDAFGYLLNVTLLSGRPVQLQPLWGPGGKGRGDFNPFEEGDHVVAFFSQGDPHRGYALGGVSNAASPIPSGFSNATPEHIHPNGKEFRSAAEATVEPLVLEALLPRLATVLTEIITALGVASAGGAVVTTETASLATDLATDFRSVGIKSE